MFIFAVKATASTKCEQPRKRSAAGAMEIDLSAAPGPSIAAHRLRESAWLATRFFDLCQNEQPASPASCVGLTAWSAWWRREKPWYCADMDQTSIF